jgi:hypothetical protein
LVGEGTLTEREACAHSAAVHLIGIGTQRPLGKSLSRTLLGVTGRDVNSRNRRTLLLICNNGRNDAPQKVCWGDVTAETLIASVARMERSEIRGGIDASRLSRITLRSIRATLPGRRTRAIYDRLFSPHSK